jgi:molybdenum cofactor cytidylyltransferase
MLEAGCGRIVLVTRPEVAAKLGEISRVTTIAAETPGQAESLQVAARRVGKRGDPRVLITPVDAPPVSIATIKALFDALKDGIDVATPHASGRGGHPVACRASVLEAFVIPEAPPTLRDVIAKHETSRARIEVDDPRVGIDLDTPDDVRTLTGQPPQFA